MDLKFKLIRPNITSNVLKHILSYITLLKTRSVLVSVSVHYNNTHNYKITYSSILFYIKINSCLQYHFSILMSQDYRRAHKFHKCCMTLKNRYIFNVFNSQTRGSNIYEKCIVTSEDTSAFH